MRPRTRGPRGHISVTDQFYEALRARAQRDGVPMSRIVEEVLQRALAAEVPR